MPEEVVVIRDENSTPGWVKSTLMRELTLDEVTAHNIVMAVQSKGEAVITSHCQDHRANAVRLASQGVQVTLREETT
jgi:ATP-dependent Clp protease adapter protein ClpS